MPVNVTISQLQQQTDELIDRVAAGERIGITRDGRVVAVLAPPGPEQRGLDGLVRDVGKAPENAATARGPADGTALGPGARPGSGHPAR
ncbi:type II toxin-antitoxin system Phd/YefM family antitoxin [Kitasatospora sp. NPDC001547]|uniref:type II toxin-antitoxin system Phd/YefM family antitoxin n=1 Tax=Kitasatospora sp. NPDC001547 TaxID=3364015 RepID=UPI003674C778